MQWQKTIYLEFSLSIAFICAVGVSLIYEMKVHAIYKHEIEHRLNL